VSCDLDPDGSVANSESDFVQLVAADRGLAPHMGHNDEQSVYDTQPPLALFRVEPRLFPRKSLATVRPAAGLILFN
jgi:hypothetical protein